jgi:hypothetical protein
LCSAELTLLGMVLAAVSRPRRPRHLAAASAAFLFVISPWLIRNEMALGRPVLRSNLGLELRVSNNDEARPQMSGNAVLYRLHPLLSPEECARVRHMGELAYNDQALLAALSWIETQPGRFTRLTIQRVLEFWFPTTPPAMRWFSLALALMAGVGLVFLRGNPAAPVFALVFAVYPLPHYFVQVSQHYRFPIHGLVLLLATHGAFKGWAILRRA